MYYLFYIHDIDPKNIKHLKVLNNNNNKPNVS